MVKFKTQNFIVSIQIMLHSKWFEPRSISSSYCHVNQKIIPFKILASGLFLKHFWNVTNSSLNILKKHFLTKMKERGLTLVFCSSNKLFQTYLYYAETDTKFCSQFNFFLASWILLSSEFCLKCRFLITGKDCLSLLARIRGGHCIKVNLHCRNEIYWKK